jgi:hypothetical protein
MKKTGIIAGTNAKTTCTSTGRHDAFGAAIWIDSDGNLYDCTYARRAKINIFRKYNTKNIDELAAN